MNAKFKSAKQPRPRDRSSCESFEEVAERAVDKGQVYDLAILQKLREQLWKELQKPSGLKSAPKILSLIIAARRQAQSEGRSAKPQTEEQMQAEVNAFVGPPVRQAS